MMTGNTVDAKLCRFFKFLENAAARYSVPEGILKATHLDAGAMLKDKKARAQFLEVTLPMVVNSSPENAERILAIRGLFESMSVEERDIMIDEKILPLLRDLASNINAALEFVEGNKQQVNSDLRTLGAYFTMFTESYLSK